MSEKGDLGLPSEAVSLPPTYAPSETFTDSPPPAYQRKNGPIIRVARMVCVTVLAVTFLIGFFIVAHRWVEAKHQVVIVEEQPTSHRLTAAEEEVSDQDKLHEPIIKGSSILALDINNGQIEDFIQAKRDDEFENFMDDMESSRESQEDEMIQPEQELPRLPLPFPFSPKGMLPPFQNQFNKIRIPLPNMNGPPNMMKPDGDCRVEKRHKNIGPGIMTETVIVICKNDELMNGDDMMRPPPPMPFFPPGANRIEPPMSLLNSILKVLSSKQMEANEMNGNPKTIRIIPMNGDNFPIFPPEPIRGETLEIPPPIRGGPHMIGGPPHLPGPLMKLIPFAKIEVRGRRPEMEEDMNDAEIMPPFHPRMHFNGPFPLHMPREEDFRREPRVLPPFKFIRINRPNNMDVNEDDMLEPPFPFPMNPIMSFLPSRKARIIRIRPKMFNYDNEASSPFPFPFMFPGGNEHEGPLPHPMPEASGRALPDPVALPGMKLLRLPFRPPQHFPLDSRITHMELRHAPNSIENEGFPFDIQRRPFKLSPFQKINFPFNTLTRPSIMHKEKEHTDDRHFPFTPNVEDIQDFNDFFPEDDKRPFQEDIEDFGPPRTHTLIQQSSRPLFVTNEENHEHDHGYNHEDPNFHTHGDGVSHSHPHDGPHTHIGNEIVPIAPGFSQQNFNLNFHRHEDGTSHSHPFNGPRTHIDGHVVPMMDDSHHHHDGPHTHMNGQIIPLPEPNMNFHNRGNHGHNDEFPIQETRPGTQEFQMTNGIVHMKPFHRKQNPNFDAHDQDEFFISEPSFGNRQEFPFNNQEADYPDLFEQLPDTFGQQSIFEDRQPHHHFEQPQFQPELEQPMHEQNDFYPNFESNLNVEEPAYLPLEPDFPFEQTEYPEEVIEMRTEEDNVPFETSFQPEEPSFQPEEPSFQPEELSFQPEEPSFQPEEPSFQPEEPSFQPEEPTFQPEEQTFQPQEPAFQPEEPSFIPEEHPAFIAEEPLFRSEEPSFIPEENPAFIVEEPLFRPEEPSFIPEEHPAFIVEEPLFRPEEPSFTPEEHPAFIVEEPLFRPEVPEQSQDAPLEDEFPGDLRGYVVEGKIAPNPPSIEEHAEMITPEDIAPLDESEVLIK